MLMKRKSLIVTLVSSFVISLVLVVTLIGYLAYIELKSEEFKRSYHHLMQGVNAKSYSRHIEFSRLCARMETSGALKGKAVIEGVVKNNGPKNITALIVNIVFFDRDGAVIYEEGFNPQEPSLGASTLPIISIPYLSSPVKVILKSGEALTFKKILANCPPGIVAALKEDLSRSKGSGSWSG
jgi:hypothetical protein